VIRARTGRAKGRPAQFLFLLLIAAAGILAACGNGPTVAPARTPNPAGSAAASGVPSGSGAPASPAPGTSEPSTNPGATATPGGTGNPNGPPSAACSGSDANREFFRQAAASMAWPVYCASLPDGWFLETGAYRLADGGRLEATYRGPGDVHLAIVEGNACAGSEVEACAPRDALIGPAAFGDREGELGRFANGLVLDLERGASPSWRVTGLGLSEQAFRELCAALVLVEG
jgi:hypothetical protein